MRAHKYRAWHFKQNRMFSAEEMAEDQLTLLPTGQFINVSGIDTSLSVIYPNDIMLPLQFIGLFDKNGREIYEGDVFPSCDDGYYDQVIYDENKFILEPYGDDSVYWEELEIVGNVYENPDLYVGQRRDQ